ncbi:Gfo/Idh/MocA family oxidoreductase [Pirellulaceae bacterium]|nr:Gfo/Idh/MocA family oxidoreductase [Pirellulaceae bacterium]
MSGNAFEQNEKIFIALLNPYNGGKENIAHLTKTAMIQRRKFLASSALIPYFYSAVPSWAQNTSSPNDRPNVGAIGLGGRGSGIAKNASAFGEIVARCDVDTKHLGGEPDNKTRFTDYRKLLEQNEIDVVTIGTPDHWHVKIAIEAMQAGKDVYCEKPLTLTIDEGKQICEAVRKTGRVLQVGTQQRSEFKQYFLQAIAMIRDGRLGKLKKVVASTGGGQTGGPFKTAPIPKTLDWNMWLGQAPMTDYIPERVHANFRWWREYAGGQMTDWGAHHVDISLWAIGIPEAGRITIDGKGIVPNVKNGYNMPAQFDVEVRMPGGLPLQLITGIRQGIRFEGTKGNMFVNRGGIYGKPVDQLKDSPLQADAIQKVYGGKTPGNHMGNFFECVKSRELPVSDVYSHHRAVTILHLANLSILLGRKLTWDLATEQIIGDDKANRHQKREPRKGFEVVV